MVLTNGGVDDVRHKTRLVKTWVFRIFGLFADPRSDAYFQRASFRLEPRKATDADLQAQEPGDRNANTNANKRLKEAVFRQDD